MDDLRWSATSQVERTVLGGDRFRDLDGRHWAYDATNGWLRYSGQGWQPDPDVPRMLEGPTGPLAEAAQRPTPATPATISEFIDRGVTDLARAYRAGELSSRPAEAALLALVTADGEGRLWTVGPRTGSWFMLDGGAWSAVPRPADALFTDALEPTRVAGNLPSADSSLLPERITAPWDPPATPTPASSDAVKSERERTSAGARRALGLVLTAAGLLSSGFGLVNGLTGDESEVAAGKTTTAPVVATSTAPVVATSTAPVVATPSTTIESTTTVARVEQSEGQLVPIQIKASSSLSAAAGNSYEPANVIDGRDDTAWCVADDGTGESLTIELAGVPVVTSVGILPGYAKTEGGDRWTENRRPTFVTWSFSSEAQYDQTPDTDDRSLQLWRLPSPKDGAKVHLTIGGTTGVADGDTCISEIALLGHPG